MMTDTITAILIIGAIVLILAWIFFDDI